MPRLPASTLFRDEVFNKVTTYHIQGEFPIGIHDVCPENLGERLTALDGETVAILVDLLFSSHPFPKFNGCIRNLLEIPR